MLLAHIKKKKKNVGGITFVKGLSGTVQTFLKIGRYLI